MHPGNHSCIVIDPGQALPVLSMLNEKKLDLAGIFITHHHWDHTNGIAEIVAQHPCPVFGPAHEARPIPYVTENLQEKDNVHIPKLELSFNIINIPAHTQGHIAYYGHSSVFCGDTLFTGGCGRLFEGSAEQMYNSLQKLASLPEDTLVYCGHEYTEANLRFANLIEPENTMLLERLINTQKLRAQKSPTVPALLSLEKATNPFLRCHLPAIQKSAEKFINKPLSNPIEVFAVIRQWKDSC